MLLCCACVTHAGLLGFHSHHQHHPQSSVHSAPSTQLREKTVSLSSVLQTEPMVAWGEKSSWWAANKSSILQTVKISAPSLRCATLNGSYQLVFFFNHRLNVCASAAQHSEHQKRSGPSRSSHVSVISKDAFKFHRLCLCSVWKLSVARSAELTFQLPANPGWSERPIREKHPFVLVW